MLVIPYTLVFCVADATAPLIGKIELGIDSAPCIKLIQVFMDIEDENIQLVMGPNDIDGHA